MFNQSNKLPLNSIGKLLLGLFVSVSCTAAPSPIPTKPSLPVGAPSLTVASNPTSVSTGMVIDSCGGKGPSERGVSYGFRDTVRLVSGDEKPFCLPLSGEQQVPQPIRSSVAILGNIPEPESLLDNAEKKMNYLGVKDYAFTWRQSDGTLMVLPVFYPRQFGRTLIAPVLTRKGMTNQNSTLEWRLEFVRRADGMPLAVLNEPFITIAESQAIRLNFGERIENGEIPPHYELVDWDSAGKPIENSGFSVGYPLRVPTVFVLGDGKKTIEGYVSIDNRQFPLVTSSFYGSQVGILLSEMPLDAFVDQNGERLSIIGVRGYTFTWRDSNGKSLVLPVIYPAQFENVRVAPVFICKCPNQQILTHWQVWLINIDTRETVKVIENPFATLETDEDLVFNDENGYLEILKLSGGIWSPTNRRVGLPLPSLQPVGVVEGMRLYRFLKEDVARFQNIVDWMKSTAPNWYQFILDQQPFDSFLDPQLSDLRWAGSASCCWLSGIRKDNGRISFQKRPPTIISDDLWYVVTFVHEATHIRDRRAKKFEEIKDRREACRASERSAVESQRAFLADLLNSNIDAQTRVIARNELHYSDEVLAKGTFDWNPRCR